MSSGLNNLPDLTISDISYQTPYVLPMVYLLATCALFYVWGYPVVSHQHCFNAHRDHHMSYSSTSRFYPFESCYSPGKYTLSGSQTSLLACCLFESLLLSVAFLIKRPSGPICSATLSSRIYDFLQDYNVLSKPVALYMCRMKKDLLRQN